MAEVIYRAEIFAEGDQFVGLCPELDVSSFDDTPEGAKRSLQEAVETFLEGCEYLGTLDEVLEESGFEKIDNTWQLRERITANEVAILP